MTLITGAVVQTSLLTGMLSWQANVASEADTASPSVCFAALWQLEVQRCSVRGHFFTPLQDQLRAQIQSLAAA